MNSQLIALSFDIETIVPIAGFIAIAIGGWVIFDLLLNKKTSTESRLDLMKQRAQGIDPKAGKSNSAKDGITKLLDRASPQITDALKPKNEKEAGKLQLKLEAAGFRGEKAMTYLVTMKLVAGVFGLFLGGAGSLLKNGLVFDMWLLVYMLGVGYLFFMLPEIVVGIMAGKRKEKIFLGLPDALDLMTVCVEAGLGQDQAMRRVTEELDKTHPVIALEFDMCNKQLQMGKTREAVLQDLGSRNGVDDLKTFAQVLIQVDRFGTSVATALRTQSEAMRIRRRQIAEEKASKTAVKLLFPLVLFIFPGIFVVLVGPAAINVIDQMLPMMKK